MLFCFVALRVCKCASERTISEQSKANGYCYLFEHTASQTKLCCLLLRMRSERRGRIWNVFVFFVRKTRNAFIAIMFHRISDVHKWTSSTKLTNSGQRLKIHIQEFSPGNLVSTGRSSTCAHNLSPLSHPSPFLNTSFHPNKSSFFHRSSPF